MCVKHNIQTEGQSNIRNTQGQKNMPSNEFTKIKIVLQALYNSLIFYIFFSRQKILVLQRQRECKVLEKI